MLSNRTEDLVHCADFPWPRSCPRLVVVLVILVQISLAFSNSPVDRQICVIFRIEPIKASAAPTAMAISTPGETDKTSIQNNTTERPASDQEDQSVSTSNNKKDEPLWHTIQRYIWDDPDKSAEEKKFLLKLDIFLLSYTCLGYFSKGIDQANINNAYVSGLKEAINMQGNDLVHASNVFTAGYIVSQIPAVILVTNKVRSSYLISTLEILWSVFTFCAAAVRTVPQLFAIRFLVGLCEGAFFPTIMYLLSSWYTRTERAKRVTLFYSTGCIANMFSGYLQAAAYDGLDGALGHAGWQWLFIICGVISLPIGVLGFFFNPDFPENTRAFFLSKDEVAFARKRLVDDGYKPLGAAAWNKTKLFQIVKTWQFWVLGTSYFLVQCACPTQQPFYALYLKATGHSVYERNVWPTGLYAVGLVTQVAAGMLSDSPLLNGRRWQAILFMQGGTIFSTIVLAIWNVPIGLRYFAFYFSYTSVGVPGLYFSWFPDLMPDDHEMRGFLTAFANM